MSEKRDLAATRRFFIRALNTTRVIPVEVLTDKAAVYPQVLDELVPGAWHHTEPHSNNRIEADHGRLKSRLRPMRGLKRLRSARVISAGHAFRPEHPPRTLRTRRRGTHDTAGDSSFL